MTTHVLYNELSGNGTGKTKAEDVKKFLNGKETVFEDVRKITDYNSFFAALKEDDEIILCGGDGTLNHFINDTEGMTYENPLYYYPTGSGNDFWNDLGKTAEDGPERIEKYLKDLMPVLRSKAFSSTTNRPARRSRSTTGISLSKRSGSLHQ